MVRRQNETGVRAELYMKLELELRLNAVNDEGTYFPAGF
jgi:hypothetical protein